MPHRSEWVACRQYGSELEASIGVAILDGSGIPAIIRSNDSVGLFGSAFQGFSAMGVTLLVPSGALAAAQTVLAFAKPADTASIDADSIESDAIIAEDADDDVRDESA